LGAPRAVPEGLRGEGVVVVGLFGDQGSQGRMGGGQDDSADRDVVEDVGLLSFKEVRGSGKAAFPRTLELGEIRFVCCSMIATLLIRLQVLVPGTGPEADSGGG
jgi:hypothetical protein